MWLGASSASAVSFTVAPGGPSGLPSEFFYDVVAGVPVAVGGGPGSSLGPGDVIDGFSADKSALTDFVLCFSVDPASVGEVAKAPAFFGVNVTTEGAAGNAQAAGDGFIGTEAFTRAGIVAGAPSLALFNNTVAVNQSPVQKEIFGLLPVVSPGIPTAAPLDDVIGGGPPMPPALYFTLAPGSPALGGFLGALCLGSPADVFFDPTPAGPGGDEICFTTFIGLGLVPGDDVDALVVFDDDMSGTFTGTDQVLFSLAPGSPSLILLGVSPADVLTSFVGFGPVLYAGVMPPAPPTIHVLGLAPGLDDLDMLELVPLVDGSVTDTINGKVVPALSQPGLMLFGLLLFAAMFLAVRRRVAA